MEKNAIHQVAGLLRQLESIKSITDYLLKDRAHQPYLEKWYDRRLSEIIETVNQYGKATSSFGLLTIKTPVLALEDVNDNATASGIDAELALIRIDYECSRGIAVLESLTKGLPEPESKQLTQLRKEFESFSDELPLNHKKKLFGCHR